MTVIWNVDDLKLPYANPLVVSEMVEWFIMKYETLEGNSIGSMHVTSGQVNYFLGMNLHYDGNGSEIITMYKFVSSIIDGFPDDKKSRKELTPESEVLFQTREPMEKLSTEKSQTFHTFVDKLLYLSKSTRLDIAIAVVFLTMHVQFPDLDD